MKWWCCFYRAPEWEPESGHMQSFGDQLNTDEIHSLQQRLKEAWDWHQPKHKISPIRLPMESCRDFKSKLKFPSPQSGLHCSKEQKSHLFQRWGQQPSLCLAGPCPGCGCAHTGTCLLAGPDGDWGLERSQSLSRYKEKPKKQQNKVSVKGETERGEKHPWKRWMNWAVSPKPPKNSGRCQGRGFQLVKTPKQGNLPLLFLCDYSLWLFCPPKESKVQ